MTGSHVAERAPTIEAPTVKAIADVPSADAMRAFGRRIAALLEAGDLVVLAGDLGAGKTTLTQGIGEGLGVRGPVTSPTFVIARAHPSLRGGPALVHVDAYRLGSLAEVDDLDLDASLEHSVTVVEWGEGLVEDLSAARLEIRLGRARGVPVQDDADEPRTVRLVGFGKRWADVAFAGTRPWGQPGVSGQDPGMSQS